MNILYVYAHPNVNSFNFQLRKKGCEVLKRAGHHLVVSDLYANKFNPVASFDDFLLSEEMLKSQYFISQKLAFEQEALSSDIKAEIEKLNAADHIIFQFPLWWFSVPAILKGWFDRVLVKGFAYDTGHILSEGLLKGKTASLVVTTQSGEASYQNLSVRGTTLDCFLHSIHHTLRFAGIEVLAPFIAYEVFNLEKSRFEILLRDYENYLEDLKK